jgi:N-acylneuraminate cytidylyltransferase
MRICIIPARGGSKRIPRKNIKTFNGKPIIAYSIEAALESGCFDKVIVSTDDDEIAAVSIDYGAEVPFLRPAELSNDHAGTIPVICHAIQWFEELGQSVTSVCCIYATAPFISASRVREAYDLLCSSHAEYCFSVTEYVFPIQRAVRLTVGNRLEMFDSNSFATRSQDLEPAYHDAGQFYWGKAAAFLADIPLFSEHATPYLLPHYLVQDIDTPDDWIRAEYIYQALKADNRC